MLAANKQTEINLLTMVLLKSLKVMNDIYFSYNWNNKLHCKIIPTLRVQSQKYVTGEIYRLRTGKKTDIGFTDIIPAFDAELIKIYDVGHYSNFTDICCMLDTGYSQKETFEILLKMYSNIDSLFFVWLFFKRLKK